MGSWVYINKIGGAHPMNKILSFLIKHKDRIQIVAVVSLVSIVALWIYQRPGETKDTDRDNSEMGVVIPKGFLIVPLDLANVRQISGMISKYGVLDVFNSRSNQLVARNLHVSKNLER